VSESESSSRRKFRRPTPCLLIKVSLVLTAFQTDLAAKVRTGVSWCLQYLAVLVERLQELEATIGTTKIAIPICMRADIKL
jgi:hypothetical protein